MMSQTQDVALGTSWREWDGRIVGGKYPLRAHLDGSEEHVVYLTEFQGRRAVIRMLPSGAPQAPAQVAAWSLAARLSHPNLVRVLDTGIWHADDEHDMQFAILEYCDESLSEVLQDRALTPDEARTMLLATLDALQYLHAQGLAHGNIDPEHVLAAGDQLKLASDSLRRNGNLGDPRRNPNEDMEKNSSIAPFSNDIWCLGITLFQSLTRRLPPRGRDGAPELNEKLLAPFDAIVSGCMQADPQRRPSLSAIRNLLDTSTSPVTTLNRTAPAEGARPTDIPTIPKTVQTSASDDAAPAPASAWKVFAIPAVGIVLVLAVLVGLHFARIPDKSTPSPAVSSPQPAATSSAATIATPASHDAVPQAKGAVLHQVMPEISAKARDTINGTVKVKARVDVNSQGRVSQAKLAARSPSAYFAKRAVEAARQWTFVAPVRNGAPQSSAWVLHFEFRRSSTKVSAESTSRG